MIAPLTEALLIAATLLHITMSGFLGNGLIRFFCFSRSGMARMEDQPPDSAICIAVLLSGAATFTVRLSLEVLPPFSKPRLSVTT